MPSTRSTTSGAGSGRLPPAAPSVGGRQPFAIAASGKLGLGGRCWLSPISMLPLYLPLSSPPTRLPPPLRSAEGSRLLSQLPGSWELPGSWGSTRCCPCTCRCPRLPQGSRRPFGWRKAAACYHSFREAWAPLDAALVPAAVLASHRAPAAPSLGGRRPFAITVSRKLPASGKLGLGGRWGKAPTTTDTVLFSGQGALPSHC